jgi:hypothetical protein
MAPDYGWAWNLFNSGPFEKSKDGGGLAAELIYVLERAGARVGLAALH